MAQRQIINGNFQDTLGNPLALGYLTFKLNTDAFVFTIDGPYGQAAAGRLVTVPLDGFGNVDGTVLLWDTDNMNPSGNTYRINAYTAAGQLVWKNGTFVLPAGNDAYNFGGDASPSFLLLETGDRILLESGGRIKLEGST